MNENRRNFLKKTAGAVLGIGAGLPLGQVAEGALGKHPTDEGVSGSTQWAMVIDIKKCLGEEVRQACSEACRKAHNLPDIPDARHEVKWIWTEEYQHVFPDQTHPQQATGVREQPVLTMCNHCKHPPCVRVCPTQATWRRDDGIVMMDMHRCIGCRYCMAACPYGSRSFNFLDPDPYIAKDPNGELPSDFPVRGKGVVEKCTFCAERIREGGRPACVEAVDAIPGAKGALTFGDLADPESGVSKLLQKEHTICRRPSLGAEPSVYYIV